MDVFPYLESVFIIRNFDIHGILNVMNNFRLGIVMMMLVWVIFVLNTLAFQYYWYWMYPWFDNPMHFLGGLWLGGTIIWILKTRHTEEGKTVSMCRYAVYIIGGAMIIGVLWELFEFSLDTFITFRVNDIVDTLSDLSMDFLGTTAAYVILVPCKKAVNSYQH